MKIRPMVVSDLGDVAALLRTSFDSNLRPYMTYAQDGIDTFLGARLTRPEFRGERTYLVCADEADRAVGFAEFVEIERGLQFLAYVCVAPHMQRRGIATSLVGHVLKSNEGTSRVELEVLDHNAAALATYRAQGFLGVDGGHTWIRRALPVAAPESTSDLVIPDTAAYEPMHADYGFSELPVTWRARDVKLGRIGSTVLRCYDVESFVDEPLLAAVRRAFPHLTEAFLVTESLDAVPDGAVVVATTTRMARNRESTAIEEGGVE